MRAVTGKATSGGREAVITVYYGKRFSTKDFRSALTKVKGELVDLARNGFDVGKIKHYPTDRKDCPAEEIPFNG